MTTCDYCDEGIPVTDGFHLITDPEGIEGTAKIACTRMTPTGKALLEPRTEAGRALRKRLTYERDPAGYEPYYAPDKDWDAAILAIEAEAAAPLRAALDGIVAELMGVEAHLDEARERLIMANATLAALAANPPAATEEPEWVRRLQSRVAKFENAYERAKELVRGTPVDWTNDPPSQEPDGWWKYTSQNNRDVIAAAVLAAWAEVALTSGPAATEERE
jgi:hypothetical protein